MPGEWRPGVALNILTCTVQPPAAENDLVPDANSAEDAGTYSSFILQHSRYTP